MPADKRFGHVPPERAAEIARFRQEGADVAADVRPAPELPDKGTEERGEPQKPEPDRPARELEQKEDGGQDGQEAEKEKEHRGQTALRQPAGRRRVGHAPDLPGADPTAVDRGPEPRLRDQLDVMVSDVWQGVSVSPVRDLEILDRTLHAGELSGVPGHIRFERANVPPVELDQAAPGDSLDDQLEVRRALRQERQEGHPGPEVHGDEAPVRIGVRLRPLEGVRLALQRPPFVLAGELGRPHLVHEPDEVLHERPLRPIFRRSESFSRPPRLPTEPGEEVVVDLVAPEPAVHPFADLAAAAEDRVDERGQHIDHRPLRAESSARAAADELLPQGPGPGGVRIDLGRERRLEAYPVEEVADGAAEARNRDEDLQGVFAPGLETGDRPLGRGDIEDANPVDLARVASADVPLDFEPDPARPGRPDAPDICLLYTSPSPRDGLLSRMP